MGNAESKAAAGKSITEIRAEVCDTVYLWFLPVSLVAGALSLSRYFEQGWLPVMTLHSILLVLLILLTLGRRHIPYPARAGSLIILMLMIGIGGHVAFGSPYALSFFISSSIMAAVFFNERTGIATALFSVAIVLGIYSAFAAHLLPAPKPPQDPLIFTTWLTNTASALMASIGPLIAVSRFRRYLDLERRRAEAASSAKSDFLATMSHELRTPMTAVLGIADLLMADNLRPQQAEKVSRIAKSGKALLSLLNDLLDISKIEAGRLAIEHVPFRLRELTTELYDLMSPLAAEKDLIFEVVYAPGVEDALVGDPTRLRQVLLNLISNAIKFTHSGRVTIHIAQNSTPDGGLSLTLQVSDTGIGIAPDRQAVLFNPFVQADTGISRRYGGTGLGLAISRQLVDLMGGDIAVSSREGHGATFSVIVPIARDDAAPAADAQTPAATQLQTPSRPLKVLATDDNETTRYLLREMLERWGHTVRLAENGAAAVKAVEAEPFDIILMDMQMPVMDGITATRTIRAMPGDAARTPILALTADVVADNRAAYLEAGANALVPKPVDWNDLAAEMKRWMPTGRSAHEQMLAAPRPARPAPASTSPQRRDVLLDDEAVAELVAMLGAESLAALLDKWHNNIAQYRSEVVTAARQNDAATVKRIAHTVKGLCLQFGAVRAAKVAASLEHTSADAALAEELAAVLGETDVALMRYRTSSSRGPSPATAAQ